LHSCCESSNALTAFCNRQTLEIDRLKQDFCRDQSMVQKEKNSEIKCDKTVTPRSSQARHLTNQYNDHCNIQKDFNFVITDDHPLEERHRHRLLSHSAGRHHCTYDRHHSSHQLGAAANAPQQRSLHFPGQLASQD
jgi:hypothetical protein